MANSVAVRPKSSSSMTSARPDVAKQLTNRLLKKDRVDVVAGVIWSNLLQAIHKQVTRSDTLLISANAGPSTVAGEGCHPNFFSLSWQNDQTPEAMGKYIQEAGVKEVYTLAPNYRAGKDMIAGFKRYFKGNITAEGLYQTRPVRFPGRAFRGAGSQP